ncbi:MAG TPA: glycine betaine ABC transporter substrate-binding protein [Devosia sp.]|jgi:glycine betaine/proline transport system substrate-binding protein|nr:glycine betaine ABC transporter substrate-binding protein [Devosia sp.]
MRRFLFLLACLGLILPGPALAQEDEAPPEGAEVSSAEPAPPAPCGGETITIARMQWPSAELLAEIHARLVAQNFGCAVQVVPGDLAATASSMGVNGQPAVAPEMWITRIADIWNGTLTTQTVRQAGATYSDPVFEGWFVPDYLAETAPEVTTVEGLKSRAAEFAVGGGRPRFVSCPPDWGCAVVNRNLLRAHGMDTIFEIVEPANRFELDALIAEAMSRREPLLFYYWQPNAILAQFAFRSVDLGAYNKDNFACLGRVACATPLPSGFPADPVIVALAQWVYLEAPEVAAYFQRAHLPFAEMNTLLQNLGEPGATIEGIADAFVAARGEVWQPWVGRPAAE